MVVGPGRVIVVVIVVVYNSKVPLTVFVTTLVTVVTRGIVWVTVWVCVEPVVKAVLVVVVVEDVMKPDSISPAAAIDEMPHMITTATNERVKVLKGASSLRHSRQCGF